MQHNRATTWLVTCLVLCSLAASAEIKVLLPAIKPFAFEENGEMRGFDVDLVKALNKKMGTRYVPEIMPLPRILLNVQQGKDVISFIARTPERENSGVWLMKIFEQPYVLISLKNSNVRPDDLAQAKLLNVGVAKGSIGEKLAIEAKLPQIDISPDEATNAKKLLAERIEVWLATLLASQAALESQGLHRQDVYVSKPVAEVETWMISSKDMSAKDRKRWLNALSQFEQSPEYVSLKSAWGLIW